MATDFSKMSKEQILALYDSETAARQAKAQPQLQPQGATQTTGQGVQDIVNQLAPKQTVRGNIADGLSVMFGGKPVSEYSAYGNNQNDLAKTYATEAIKNEFEDPTVKELRQAEIDALKTPPPQGFVRIGRQIQPDPNYIKPKEQREIDEAKSLEQSQVEALRSDATQSISAIEAAKKGSKFFGPLGDVSSKYAPSSFMGIGDYKDRSVWEANVDNLLSKKVVDLIGQMKSLSKTGATGFGQLSDKEGQLLQQASTVLNKNLPPEQATYYLNEMEKIYQKVLAGGSSQPSNNPNDLNAIEAELAQINAQLGQ